MVRFDMRILAKVLLVFAALFTSASAQTTAQSPGRKLPTIPFEKYRLKNGLEVILSEDHTLPQPRGVRSNPHPGRLARKPAGRPSSASEW